MILGLIPARGNSEGLPKKNARICAGKPLIIWTIESAQQSKLLDKIVVSTEDKEIKKISQYYGMEVIDRPPELATSDSLVIETYKHTLKQYPKTDVLVSLQCTSPIRRPGLIDLCISEYQKWQPSVLVVVTGFDCHYKPFETYVERRQDLSTFFYNDGNVYVYNPSLIKSGIQLSKRYYGVRTSKENVEIDDEFDFWLAEQILLKRREENGKKDFKATN